MTGWRHARAFMAVVALLLDAHTGVWAQASNERTDTFEQRFPPDQVTTPPGGEQPPRQPPFDKLRLRSNLPLIYRRRGNTRPEGVRNPRSRLLLWPARDAPDRV